MLDPSLFYISRIDGDSGKNSPVKRGPGRPRKRKNCGNQKGNNEPSEPNSPSSVHPENLPSSPVQAPTAEQDVGTDEPVESWETKSPPSSPVVLTSIEEVSKISNIEPTTEVIRKARAES